MQINRNTGVSEQELLFMKNKVLNHDDQIIQMESEIKRIPEPWTKLTPTTVDSNTAVYEITDNSGNLKYHEFQVVIMFNPQTSTSQYATVALYSNTVQKVSASANLSASDVSVLMTAEIYETSFLSVVKRVATSGGTSPASRSVLTAVVNTLRLTLTDIHEVTYKVFAR